ncbi:MAG: hypothetical protein IT376_19155 [Polyangiaceae bacterium]|nr:hypothetical protein [Polyangiaceae bacterium]
MSMLAAALGVIACGPSVQAVHDSNVRFEHCYRLDLDPAIVPSHRLACWREWSLRYTFGQNRDRLEYARRRMELLAAGDTRPLELSLADGGAPRDAAPSLAFAPASPAAPPPVVRPLDTPPAPSVAPPPPPEPQPEPDRPGAGCVQKCESAHDDCAAACEDEKSRACARCTGEYRACMRRCFR